MQAEKTKKLVLCALFVALIIVGAFIKIPIPVVPFTLQILFTTLAGLLLGGKGGAAAVGIYIFMGLVGIPVFAEGGGFAYVLKPSFGYILGFAAASYIVGAMANRGAYPTYRRLIIINFIGLGVVYLFGMVYYYLISRFYMGEPIGIWPLFLYCFILAVPGDIVLCFIGAFVAKKLMPLLKRSGIKLESDIKSLTDKVLSGGQITKAEAMCLYRQPIDLLCESADMIRRKFCSNQFDICTIINGKSGNCSENCKFCAQSAKSKTCTEQYPLLSADEIVSQARTDYEKGALRFSIVTSGRSLPDVEVDKMCEAVRRIRSEVGISVCVSFGLLNEAQYAKLKDAGVTRVHNNLETSERNFPNVCTSHTFEDKLQAIRAAQAAGLFVCSGGIMGLGETLEDRIDMALCLRELGIESVPINMLNPISGTPFENNEKLTEDDMRRIVAVFRFILPHASIRLAGGRGILEDKGKSCFLSGANAAISGDMLTTAGITIQTDMQLLRDLGYRVELCNE